MNITDNRLEELKTFRIQPWPPDIHGTYIANLFDEDTCRTLLTTYKNAIDAPNLKVAASLFIKHYARVSVASTLHHLALHNGALRLPPTQIGLSEDNKTLYINKQVDHWIDLQRNSGDLGGRKYYMICSVYISRRC